MMTHLRRATPLIVVAVALLNMSSTHAQDVRALAVNPTLGAADPFGVLGGSTVTNTGPTNITGDLGVSPGTAITGFPPGTRSGATHAGDATAGNAQNSVTTAYNMLAAQPCNVNLTGQNLGGLTLSPGVYCFNSSAQLTGTLTLNGLGNPGSVWVFQTGSTITTASGSAVNFVNGGQACGVHWQIGSSATIGSNTSFQGNIFALASITLNTGARSAGALFARSGAVTLDSNVVARAGSCGFGPAPTPTPLPPTPTPPAPTPVPPGPPGPTPPVPTLPDLATGGLLVLLLVTGTLVLGRR